MPEGQILNILIVQNPLTGNMEGGKVFYMKEELGYR